MKERATIICRRDEQVLLVARDRSRWSLPGGTIKRNESPSDAALRELREETAIDCVAVRYLFQFGGLRKRHHVFTVDLHDGVHAEPRNEITRCRWFRIAQISTLGASVPTRGIVALSLLTEMVRDAERALAPEHFAAAFEQTIEPAFPAQVDGEDECRAASALDS